jgi:hypothetical protein
VLGFDAVRRRRDVEEERGTKTRRVGRWKRREEKRVLAPIFIFSYFNYFMSLLWRKRKAAVVFT